MTASPTQEQKSRLKEALSRHADRDAGFRLSCERQVAGEAEVSLLTVECYALRQGIIPCRYESNMGTLGTEGQLTLLQSKALIAGLGGLGGNVLESLARLGVGRIVGADPDRFEEKNLNRQVLACTDNTGESKPDAAARRVSKINPAVQFTPRHTELENLPEEDFQDCALVFDCLDSQDARRHLAATCARSGVPLIHGAVAGWSGQVAVCRPDKNIIDELYSDNAPGLEQKLGNMAATPAAAANLMVTHGLRMLLDAEKPPPGQVVFFDLLHDQWRTVHL